MSINIVSVPREGDTETNTFRISHDGIMGGGAGGADRDDDVMMMLGGAAAAESYSPRGAGEQQDGTHPTRDDQPGLAVVNLSDDVVPKVKDLPPLTLVATRSAERALEHSLMSHHNPFSSVTAPGRTLRNDEVLPSKYYGRHVGSVHAAFPPAFASLPTRVFDKGMMAKIRSEIAPEMMEVESRVDCRRPASMSRSEKKAAVKKPENNASLTAETEEKLTPLLPVQDAAAAFNNGIGSDEKGSGNGSGRGQQKKHRRKATAGLKAFLREKRGYQVYQQQNRRASISNSFHGGGGGGAGAGKTTAASLKEKDEMPVFTLKIAKFNNTSSNTHVPHTFSATEGTGGNTSNTFPATNAFSSSAQLKSPTSAMKGANPSRRGSILSVGSVGGGALMPNSGGGGGGGGGGDVAVYGPRRLSVNFDDTLTIVEQSDAEQQQQNDNGSGASTPPKRHRAPQHDSTSPLQSPSSRNALASNNGLQQYNQSYLNIFASGGVSGGVSHRAMGMIPMLFVQFEGDEAPFMALENCVHPLDNAFDLREQIVKKMRSMAGGEQLAKLPFEFANHKSLAVKLLGSLQNIYETYFDESDYIMTIHSDAKEVKTLTRLHRQQAKMIEGHIVRLKKTVERNVSVDSLLPSLKMPKSVSKYGPPSAGFYYPYVPVSPALSTRHLQMPLVAVKALLEPISKPIISELTRKATEKAEAAMHAELMLSGDSKGMSMNRAAASSTSNPMKAFSAPTATATAAAGPTAVSTSVEVRMRSAAPPVDCGVTHVKPSLQLAALEVLRRIRWAKAVRLHNATLAFINQHSTELFARRPPSKKNKRATAKTKSESFAAATAEEAGGNGLSAALFKNPDLKHPMITKMCKPHVMRIPIVTITRPKITEITTVNSPLAAIVDEATLLFTRAFSVVDEVTRGIETLGTEQRERQAVRIASASSFFVANCLNREDSAMASNSSNSQSVINTTGGGAGGRTSSPLGARKRSTTMRHNAASTNAAAVRFGAAKNNTVVLSGSGNGAPPFACAVMGKDGKIAAYVSRDESKNTAINYDSLRQDLTAGDVPLTWRDASGLSLLHYAVLREDVELITMLCKAGIDVCYRAYDGRTAAHLVLTRRLGGAQSSASVRKIAMLEAIFKNATNQQNVSALFDVRDFYSGTTSASSSTEAGVPTAYTASFGGLVSSSGRPSSSHLHIGSHAIPSSLFSASAVAAAANSGGRTLMEVALTYCDFSVVRSVYSFLEAAKGGPSVRERRAFKRYLSLEDAITSCNLKIVKWHFDVLKTPLTTIVGGPDISSGGIPVLSFALQLHPLLMNRKRRAEEEERLKKIAAEEAERRSAAANQSPATANNGLVSIVKNAAGAGSPTRPFSGKRRTSSARSRRDSNASSTSMGGCSGWATGVVPGRLAFLPSEESYRELLMWLIVRGVPSTLCDANGRNAFHYAARCGASGWIMPMLKALKQGIGAADAMGFVASPTMSPPAAASSPNGATATTGAALTAANGASSPITITPSSFTGDMGDLIAIGEQVMRVDVNGQTFIHTMLQWYRGAYAAGSSVFALSPSAVTANVSSAIVNGVNVLNSTAGLNTTTATTAANGGPDALADVAATNASSIDQNNANSAAAFVQQRLEAELLPILRNSLVAPNIDHFTIDSHGNTMLHWALYCRSAAVLSFFARPLQFDTTDIVFALATLRNKDGDTPLSIAIRANFSKGVAILMSRDIAAEALMSPVAINTVHTASSAFGGRHGNNNNSAPVSVTESATMTAAELLSNSAKFIEQQQQQSEGSSDGNDNDGNGSKKSFSAVATRAPLLLAVDCFAAQEAFGGEHIGVMDERPHCVTRKENHCVEILLQCLEKHGLNVRKHLDITSGPRKETALHSAVRHRLWHMAALLLTHHASSTIPNGDGLSPLQLACKDSDDIHIARLLLSNDRTSIESGASLSACVSLGGAIAYKTDLLQEFFFSRVAFDLRGTPLGHSVLMAAARSGNLKLMRYVLERGARELLEANNVSSIVKKSTATMAPSTDSKKSDAGAAAAAEEETIAVNNAFTAATIDVSVHESASFIIPGIPLNAPPAATTEENIDVVVHDKEDVFAEEKKETTTQQPPSTTTPASESHKTSAVLPIFLRAVRLALNDGPTKLALSKKSRLVRHFTTPEGLHECVQIALLMIRLKFRITETVLTDAIACGFPALVTALLQHPAVGNKASFLEYEDIERGDTPLHMACRKATPGDGAVTWNGIVFALCERSSRTNARNHSDETPLSIAIHNNNALVAVRLILSGHHFSNPFLATAEGKPLRQKQLHFVLRPYANDFLESKKQLAIRRISLLSSSWLRDRVGWKRSTILTDAVCGGRMDIVGLFLQAAHRTERHSFAELLMAPFDEESRITEKVFGHAQNRKNAARQAQGLGAGGGSTVLPKLDCVLTYAAAHAPALCFEMLLGAVADSAAASPLNPLNRPATAGSNATTSTTTHTMRSGPTPPLTLQYGCVRAALMNAISHGRMSNAEVLLSTLAAMKKPSYSLARGESTSARNSNRHDGDAANNSDSFQVYCAFPTLLHAIVSTPFKTRRLFKLFLQVLSSNIDAAAQHEWAARMMLMRQALSRSLASLNNSTRSSVMSTRGGGGGALKKSGGRAAGGGGGVASGALRAAGANVSGLGLMGMSRSLLGASHSVSLRGPSRVVLVSDIGIGPDEHDGAAMMAAANSSASSHRKIEDLEAFESMGANNLMAVATDGGATAAVAAHLSNHTNVFPSFQGSLPGSNNRSNKNHHTHFATARYCSEGEGEEVIDASPILANLTSLNHPPYVTTFPADHAPSVLVALLSAPSVLEWRRPLDEDDWDLEDEDIVDIAPFSELVAEANGLRDENDDDDDDGNFVNVAAHSTSSNTRPTAAVNSGAEKVPQAKEANGIIDAGEITEGEALQLLQASLGIATRNTTPPPAAAAAGGGDGGEAARTTSGAAQQQNSNIFPSSSSSVNHMQQEGEDDDEHQFYNNATAPTTSLLLFPTPVDAKAMQMALEGVGVIQTSPASIAAKRRYQQQHQQLVSKRSGGASWNPNASVDGGADSSGYLGYSGGDNNDAATVDSANDVSVPTPPIICGPGGIPLARALSDLMLRALLQVEFLDTMEDPYPVSDDSEDEGQDTLLHPTDFFAEKSKNEKNKTRQRKILGGGGGSEDGDGERTSKVTRFQVPKDDDDEEEEEGEEEQQEGDDEDENEIDNVPGDGADTAAEHNEADDDAANGGNQRREGGGAARGAADEDLGLNDDGLSLIADHFDQNNPEVQVAEEAERQRRVRSAEAKARKRQAEMAAAALLAIPQPMILLNEDLDDSNEVINTNALASQPQSGPKNNKGKSGSSSLTVNNNNNAFGASHHNMSEFENTIVKSEMMGGGRSEYDDGDNANDDGDEGGKRAKDDALVPTRRPSEAMGALKSANANAAEGDGANDNDKPTSPLLRFTAPAHHSKDDGNTTLHRPSVISRTNASTAGNNTNINSVGGGTRDLLGGINPADLAASSPYASTAMPHNYVNRIYNPFAECLTMEAVEHICRLRLTHTVNHLVAHLGCFPQLVGNLSQHVFSDGRRFLDVLMELSIPNTVVKKAIDCAREEAQLWRTHGAWWIETLLDVRHPELIRRIPAPTRQQFPVLSLFREMARSDPTTTKNLSEAYYEETPLHTAIRKGRSKITAHILQSTCVEVDVNVKNNKGRTPLMLAAMLNRNECASQLVSTGVDVMVEDVDGMTALHHAAAAGSAPIVELILADDDGSEAACNSSTKPYASYPIVQALKNGKDDCAFELLTSLASERAPKEITMAKSGETLLHFAAMTNCTISMEALLQHAASSPHLSALTVDGCSCRDYAAIGSSMDLLLKNAGVKRYSLLANPRPVTLEDVENHKHFVSYALRDVCHEGQLYITGTGLAQAIADCAEERAVSSNGGGSDGRRRSSASVGVYGASSGVNGGKKTNSIIKQRSSFTGGGGGVSFSLPSASGGGASGMISLNNNANPSSVSANTNNPAQLVVVSQVSAVDELAFRAASDGEDDTLLSLLKLGATDSVRLRVYNLPPASTLLNDRERATLSREVATALLPYGGMSGILMLPTPSELAVLAGNSANANNSRPNSATDRKGNDSDDEPLPAIQPFDPLTGIALPTDGNGNAAGGGGGSDAHLSFFNVAYYGVVLLADDGKTDQLLRKNDLVARRRPLYFVRDTPKGPSYRLTARQGRTGLLHLVCKHNCVKSLQFIIESNSQLGIASKKILELMSSHYDEAGLTPYHYVVLSESWPCLTLFLKAQVPQRPARRLAVGPPLSCFPSHTAMFDASLIIPSTLWSTTKGKVTNWFGVMDINTNTNGNSVTAKGGKKSMASLEYTPAPANLFLPPTSATTTAAACSAAVSTGSGSTLVNKAAAMRTSIISAAGTNTFLSAANNNNARLSSAGSGGGGGGGSVASAAGSMPLLPLPALQTPETEDLVGARLSLFDDAGALFYARRAGDRRTSRHVITAGLERVIETNVEAMHWRLVRDLFADINISTVEELDDADSGGAVGGGGGGRGGEGNSTNNSEQPNAADASFDAFSNSMLRRDDNNGYGGYGGHGGGAAVSPPFSSVRQPAPSTAQQITAAAPSPLPPSSAPPLNLGEGNIPAVYLRELVKDGIEALVVNVNADEFDARDSSTERERFKMVSMYHLAGGVLYRQIHQLYDELLHSTGLIGSLGAGGFGCGVYGWLCASKLAEVTIVPTKTEEEARAKNITIRRKLPDVSMAMTMKASVLAGRNNNNNSNNAPHNTSATSDAQTHDSDSDYEIVEEHAVHGGRLQKKARKSAGADKVAESFGTLHVIIPIYATAKEVIAKSLTTAFEDYFNTAAVAIAINILHEISSIREKCGTPNIDLVVCDRFCAIVHRLVAALASQRFICERIEDAADYADSIAAELQSAITKTSGFSVADINHRLNTVLSTLTYVKQHVIANAPAHFSHNNANNNPFSDHLHDRHLPSGSSEPNGAGYFVQLSKGPLIHVVNPDRTVLRIVFSFTAMKREVFDSTTLTSVGQGWEGIGPSKRLRVEQQYESSAAFSRYQHAALILGCSLDSIRPPTAMATASTTAGAGLDIGGITSAASIMMTSPNAAINKANANPTDFGIGARTVTSANVTPAQQPLQLGGGGILSHSDSESNAAGLQSRYGTIMSASPASFIAANVSSSISGSNSVLGQNQFGAFCGTTFPHKKYTLYEWSVDNLPFSSVFNSVIAPVMAVNAHRGMCLRQSRLDQLPPSLREKKSFFGKHHIHHSQMPRRSNANTNSGGRAPSYSNSGGGVGVSVPYPYVTGVVAGGDTPPQQQQKVAGRNNTLTGGGRGSDVSAVVNAMAALTTTASYPSASGWGDDRSSPSSNARTPTRAAGQHHDDGGMGPSAITRTYESSEFRDGQPLLSHGTPPHDPLSPMGAGIDFHAHQHAADASVTTTVDKSANNGNTPLPRWAATLVTFVEDIVPLVPEYLRDTPPENYPPLVGSNLLGLSGGGGLTSGAPSQIGAGGVKSLSPAMLLPSVAKHQSIFAPAPFSSQPPRQDFHSVLPNLQRVATLPTVTSLNVANQNGPTTTNITNSPSIVNAGAPFLIPTIKSPDSLEASAGRHSNTNNSHLIYQHANGNTSLFGGITRTTSIGIVGGVGAGGAAAGVGAGSAGPMLTSNNNLLEEEDKLLFIKTSSGVVVGMRDATLPPTTLVVKNRRQRLSNTSGAALNTNTNNNANIAAHSGKFSSLLSSSRQQQVSVPTSSGASLGHQHSQVSFNTNTASPTTTHTVITRYVGGRHTNLVPPLLWRLFVAELFELTHDFKLLLNGVARTCKAWRSAVLYCLKNDVFVRSAVSWIHSAVRSAEALLARARAIADRRESYGWSLVPVGARTAVKAWLCVDTFRTQRHIGVRPHRRPCHNGKCSAAKIIAGGKKGGKPATPPLANERKKINYLRRSNAADSKRKNALKVVVQQRQQQNAQQQRQQRHRMVDFIDQQERGDADMLAKSSDAAYTADVDAAYRLFLDNPHDAFRWCASVVGIDAVAVRPELPQDKFSARTHWEGGAGELHRSTEPNPPRRPPSAVIADPSANGHHHQHRHHRDPHIVSIIRTVFRVEANAASLHSAVCRLSHKLTEAPLITAFMNRTLNVPGLEGSGGAGASYHQSQYLRASLSMRQQALGLFANSEGGGGGGALGYELSINGSGGPLARLPTLSAGLSLTASKSIRENNYVPPSPMASSTLGHNGQNSPSTPNIAATHLPSSSGHSDSASQRQQQQQQNTTNNNGLVGTSAAAFAASANQPATTTSPSSAVVSNRAAGGNQAGKLLPARRGSNMRSFGGLPGGYTHPSQGGGGGGANGPIVPL